LPEPKWIRDYGSTIPYIGIAPNYMEQGHWECPSGWHSAWRNITVWGGDLSSIKPICQSDDPKGSDLAASRDSGYRRRHGKPEKGLEGGDAVGCPIYTTPDFVYPFTPTSPCIGTGLSEPGRGKARPVEKPRKRS